MGYGLLNYRVPLPAACQTPNLEDQRLERSNSRHQVSPASETTRANPSSGRWNYGREIAENFAESVTSTSLLCSLRHATDGFTTPPKEGALRIFSPETFDGFGRVWTRELGYQRPARSPLDHRKSKICYREKLQTNKQTNKQTNIRWN